MTTEPDRVTALEHVANHSEIALSRLTDLLRNATAYRALVKSYIDQLQRIEDVLWQAYNDTIETSEGVQLDVLGRIVGALRGAFSDAEYRTLIRATIRANRSDGTTEDLIAVTSLLLSGEGPIHVRQYPRATVIVDPLTTTPYPDVMLRLLLRAASAGVKLQMIVSLDDHGFAFAASGIVNQFDADIGWSNTSGLVGGRLVGVLE